MKRKIVRIFLAAFLLAALIGTGAWIAVSRSAAPYIASLEDMQHARAGIVLGAAPLVAKNRPNGYFVHRMDAAAALFKAGKVDYLIVSGDRKDKVRPGYARYDEPEAMRAALVARGVPEDRIKLDYAGFHTRDSIRRAWEVFHESSAIVVSQRFHVERALFVAHAHGLPYRGFAADDVSIVSRLPTLSREVVSRIVSLYDAWTAPRLLQPACDTGKSDGCRRA